MTMPSLPTTVMEALGPALEAIRAEVEAAVHAVERRRVGRSGEAIARFNSWASYGPGHRAVMLSAFGEGPTDGPALEALADPVEVPIMPTTETLVVAGCTCPACRDAREPVRTCECDHCDATDCNGGCEDCDDDECSQCHDHDGCVSRAECPVCDDPTADCCGYCSECGECHGEGDDDTRTVGHGTYCRECDHECVI